MKSPCELIVWYLLPAIRAELSKALKKEHVLQKDTAEYLDMTPSAVSLYISGKRGGDMELPGEIKLKIQELAKRIIAEDMSNRRRHVSLHGNEMSLPDMRGNKKKENFMRYS